MNPSLQSIIVFIACCLAVATAGPAMADRQNTISGSIGLRQGYDSNVNRTEADEIEEWTTSLVPSISVNSKGRRDSLDFTYSPSYKYNYRLDEGSFEHHLALAADRALSDKLLLSLNDSFEKSDDSTLFRNEMLGTSNQVNLSDNIRRRKYWTNYVNIDNAWQYAPNSSLTYGYTHTIYNADGTSQDYQRHAPHIEISNQINQQWTVGVKYTYIVGDFKSSYDSKQHSASGRLTYSLSSHRAIYGQGEYSSTDYSGSGIDYYTSGGLLGFTQQIDQNTALDVAAGYSSANRDNGSNSDGFNSSLSFTRRYEKGAFTLSGASGFQDQRFNGEDDGLDKFWTAKSTISYQLTESLSSSIYVLYHNDRYVEQLPEREDDSYEAGGSVNWSFARWYTAGIRYVFHKLDSSLAGFDYDDHQLYLTLSAAKELWKW